MRLFIGPKRPLVVVGNKVDLLQDWSKDMLERAKLALQAQIPPKANVLHTALISAKTGFGIEDLVTALYDVWEYKGKNGVWNLDWVFWEKSLHNDGMLYLFSTLLGLRLFERSSLMLSKWNFI
jgi:tRNA U34 5-carboxymethylaminomethyl modifying GTPase MnmE/TrmE